MRQFAGWLSEKDRRRYAAIEALKLGHGGIDYISRLLGCDTKTIRQGTQDLEQPQDPAGDRVRKKGGRRPLAATRPSLEENLRRLLQEFTGGDSMRVGVLWTNLSLRELSRRLLGMGTPASRRTIRRLLRKLKPGGARPARRRRWGNTPTAMPSSRTSVGYARSQSGSPVVSQPVCHREAKCPIRGRSNSCLSGSFKT